MDHETDRDSHRAWPVPPGPWLMAQTWHDALFAHWPLPPDVLRFRLPAGLELDTFGGQAWLGILPLRVSGVRLRGLPPVPFLSSLAQVNVRTYVVGAGRPGVFFFRLYASSVAASLGARVLYSAPYEPARISVQSRDGQVHYACEQQRAATSATFCAVCGPISEPFEPQPGTVEQWFVDRYRLFTLAANGRLYRAEIDHGPWSLQHAQADIQANTLAEAQGLALPPGQPLLHFSKEMPGVTLWPVEPA